MAISKGDPWAHGGGWGGGHLEPSHQTITFLTIQMTIISMIVLVIIRISYSEDFI
jgi:hypothetical protein